MKSIYSVAISFFTFITLSGSLPGSKHIIDPYSVEIMPISEAEKKLKALENSYKLTENWKEVKASQIYKEHAALEDSLKNEHKERQLIHEKLQNINNEEHDSDLQDRIHDLDSSIFNKSKDLTLFESSRTACPHLLERANLLAVFWRSNAEHWRSKYEELKASCAQPGECSPKVGEDNK